MFIPKKTKHKKFRKIKQKNISKGGSSLAFGDFGIKATSFCRLDARQLESARRVITRMMAKSGKIWIRCFPGIPVTKKPTDVRMGGGKGSVDKYVFATSPGRIIFELAGVTEQIAVSALTKASAKLPCPVDFVRRSVF